MNAEIKKTSEPRQGLCVNCGAADDCGLASPGASPTAFCEEHWVVDAARENSDKSGPQSKVLNRPASSSGLCLNCLHQAGCELPRNEGGVWYCEEYE